MNVDVDNDDDSVSAEDLVREIARLRRNLAALRAREEGEKGSRSSCRSCQADEETGRGAVAGVGCAGRCMSSQEQQTQQQQQARARTRPNDSHQPSAPPPSQRRRQQQQQQPGAYRVRQGRSSSDSDDGILLSDDDEDDDDRPMSDPPLPPPSYVAAPHLPLDEIFVPEADLVVEDPVLATATLVRQGRRVLAVTGLALTASVVAALAVGLPLGLVLAKIRSRSRLASNTSTTSTATTTTTRTPVDYELVPVANLRAEFNANLPRPTREAIARPGGTTPQAKAYRWLFGGGVKEEEEEGDEEEGRHPPLPGPEAASRLETRFALAVLYYSLTEVGGASQKGRGEGWLDSKSQHECLWDGVDCGGSSTEAADAVADCKVRLGIRHTASCRLGGTNESSRSIESIHLANVGLGGTLPDEIRLLTSVGVASLRLEGNGLVGTIPPGLVELTTLKHLMLGSNMLHGSIPSAIGRLGSLATLHLSQNDLSGTIPAAIANLSGLVHLDVSRNRLVGSVPRDVGRLLALEVLDASETRRSRRRFRG
jgi:Leucine rich repeat